MIENKSGFKPLGRAVLVEPYEPERAESLIVMPDSVQNRNMMLEQRAIVVAIGPACWSDEPAPRAAPGDKVMVSKMAGWQGTGPLDGKMYRVINDRDIFLAISEES